MQMGKSVLVLLGKYSGADHVRGTDEEEKLLRDAMAHCGIAAEKVYSLTSDVAVEVDKWHGVKLAGEAGLEAQWRWYLHACYCGASDHPELDFLHDDVQ